MSSTGTNTKTDQELTGLMRGIEREIRLELYCIVQFFDHLFSKDEEQIDQEKYLFAIDFAEKSVQSMTVLIKSNPPKFNAVLFKDNINIIDIVLEIVQSVPQFFTNPLQSLGDIKLHYDMIDKLKNRPDIQNYLLSLACLKILDQQSYNQDRTQEEQKALDDYNNFVAEIKKIFEIKELAEIKAIWDNHQ
jgi:hypothetical protein